MSDDRNLTDHDVEAIVTELKKQMLADFQIEVARGLMGWVKKAVVVLLIYLALQGIAGDRNLLQSIAATTR